MKEKIKAMVKCRIFSGIPEEDIESMLRYLKPKIKKYKKGSHIINIGDVITDVIVILEGGVQLVKEDLLGARSLIAHYGAGESLFETSASVKTKGYFGCYVTCNSLIMSIPFENIMRVPRSLKLFNAQIVKNLISILAEKSLSIYMQLEHASRHDIRKKLLSYLIFQKEKAGTDEFVIPLSKTDLADFLFINRSAMTRELASMKKDNIISFKGRKFTIKKTN
ncbi:MAG: Crp/Fnr family transcriptional regulator [Endomicrobium sp.]|nr:Crp/Fnr family transcriptional regulator [Endomicrobium sp.]